MQALRQALTIAIQRPLVLERSSVVIQQIRFNGSDPRSSTSSDNHKNGGQSDSSQGSDLNKSKGGDKKQNSSTTDDTDQPGTKREEWSDPNKVVGNDPPYGKAGGSVDAHDPDRGKN